MTETPVSALTDLEAAAELAFLAKRMAELDKAYYQADDPLVSDAEYDALKRRNEAIEARFPHLVRADSPSKKVGAKASEDFAKVTHSVPMLSLGNIFSTDEIFEFSNLWEGHLRIRSARGRGSGSGQTTLCIGSLPSAPIVLSSWCCFLSRHHSSKVFPLSSAE